MMLRKFEKEDLGEVMRISEAAFGNSFDSRFYMAIHDTWDEGFVIYEEKGIVRGFIAGLIVYETEARILMLAVDPNFRRKGIGGSLMGHFIELCNTRGVRRIYLEVRVSNTNAVEFYLRYGFSKGSTYHGFYEDGEDALVMWKSL